MRQIEVRSNGSAGTWLAAFIMIVLTGMLAGCGSANMRAPGGFGIEERFSLLDNQFETLWQERTISMTMNYSGGFLVNGGGGYGGGAFPISVRATLMDSLLIDKGIETFANLAEMSDEEIVAFRERYYAEHPLNDYLFVWAEISTRYHESYLDLDRWIFYLEDDQGHQFEPSKVVEMDMRESQVNQVVQPDMRGAQYLQFARMFERNPEKIVEFYFPKTSFYGEKLVGGDNTKLILGAVNREDMEERAGGTWDLSALFY